MKEYASIDTVLYLEDAVHYPTEFLNSLNPAGLPPHKLTLKNGIPIILLRNLRPPALCNGTRLVVKKLHTNVSSFPLKFHLELQLTKLKAKLLNMSALICAQIALHMVNYMLVCQELEMPKIKQYYCLYKTRPKMWCISKYLETRNI